MVDTQTAMANVLRLALMDPMVRMLEPIYRNMEDHDEGALCLALVIEQGADSYAIQFDQSAMLAAIKAHWQA